MAIYNSVEKKVKGSAGMYKLLIFLLVLVSGIISIQDRGLFSSLELIGGIISLYICLYGF